MGAYSGMCQAHACLVRSVVRLIKPIVYNEWWISHNIKCQKIVESVDKEYMTTLKVNIFQVWILDCVRI